MLHVLLALAVFTSATALDYAAAKYQEQSRLKRRHSAASWAVATGLLATVSAVIIIDVSWWYIIPELVGSYVGTFIAVGKSPEIHERN